MTNGEKMLNVFCDSKALELGGNVSFRDGDWAIMFPDEWWHTQYKEPTTNNDLGVDCISREEAIKTIQRYGVGCFDADEFSPEECERFVIAKLNELPPVTPQEPRKGHWIKHNTPSNTYYYDCSLCGCVAPCTETADSYLWKLSNFCPDCGCRMEGVNNVNE